MERFFNRKPSDTALILDDDIVTFGTIYQLAERISSELRNNFEPLDRVVFSSQGVVAYVAGMFAAWECRIVFCCWNGQADQAEMAELVGAAGFVLTGEQCKFTVHRIGNYGVNRSESNMLQAGNLILTTSGSSGAAKGVLLRFESVIENACLAGQAIGVADKALLRWCICIDISLMSALSHLFMAWNASLPLRVMSVLNHKTISNEFASGSVGFGGAPMQLNTINQFVTRPKRGMLMVSSGDFLSRETVEEINRKNPAISVASFYGLTELSGRFCVLDEKDILNRLGSAGKPLIPGSVRIEGSEVIATSYLLFEGYFRAEGRFEQHSGEFLTGDLGQLDDAGFLWLSGRDSDIFKVSGLKVSRRVVEATLTNSGLLRKMNFVVLPVSHPSMGTCCALFLEKTPGFRGPSLRDLVLAIKKQHPSTHIPVYSYALDALPTLSNGKIDKQYLIANHAEFDRYR